MQKLLIWLSVLGVVGVGGKHLIDYMSRSAHERTARLRVEAFLEGMAPGGNFEEAIGMFLDGNPGGMGNISQDEHNMYVTELNAFLAQRDVGHPIETYEVHGATMVRPPEGIQPSLVDVSCTIDGKPAVIRAADGKHLTWAD